MREQPRRDWHSATKRQWVTPKVRSVPLTEDVLRLFGSAESTAGTLEACGQAGRAPRSR